METKQLPVIAGFEDIEPLAEGGSSRVYKGRWALSGEPVAIKVADSQKTPKADELIRTEAKTQFSLSNPEKPHPDIVKVLLSGSTQDGQPFFAMGLMDKGLDEALRNGGLPFDKMLGYLKEALNGLDAAHETGIVHGDVKPGNILLKIDGNGGDAKISDFGLGIKYSGNEGAFLSGTQTSIRGTGEYIAPEILQNQRPTPLSDIYSFGVTMHEALTGHKPEAGTKPRELNKYVSERLDNLIIACLRRDPSRRPQSVKELLKELDGNPIELSPDKQDLQKPSETPEKPKGPTKTRTVVVSKQNPDGKTTYPAIEQLTLPEKQFESQISTDIPLNIIKSISQDARSGKIGMDLANLSAHTRLAIYIDMLAENSEENIGLYRALLSTAGEINIPNVEHVKKVYMERVGQIGQISLKRAKQTDFLQGRKPLLENALEAYRILEDREKIREIGFDFYNLSKRYIRKRKKMQALKIAEKLVAEGGSKEDLEPFIEAYMQKEFIEQGDFKTRNEAYKSAAWLAQLLGKQETVKLLEKTYGGDINEERYNMERELDRLWSKDIGSYIVGGICAAIPATIFGVTGLGCQRSSGDDLITMSCGFAALSLLAFSVPISRWRRKRYLKDQLEEYR